MFKLKPISKHSNLSYNAINFAVIALLFGWSPISEAQNLTNQLDDGVGLACEKEGNTNRKVYRSFFKFSKDRKVLAILEYRDDQPIFIALHETTVLPEFIEWKNF